MCSYERAGWLGSRDLGFSNRKFCHMWTLQPGYRDESGMNSGGPDGIIIVCIFYVVSISFNSNSQCSESDLRAFFFSFAMFCLFLRILRQNSSQDLWPFLISETGLKLLLWTQGEIHPGNRSHMKKPLIESRILVTLFTTALVKYT